ncbi:MAG: PEGA domain-containing protein [Myxococcota bacterium]
MKACPICQSTYEDWIEFCFNDGVPLVAYEPKPPPPRASAPRPPVSAPASSTSSYDAPEARMVSGADLPEPARLSRFAAPTPPVVVAPPAPVSPVSIPPVAPPVEPAAVAPVEVAPAADVVPAPEETAPVAAPVEPAAPVPDYEERTAPAHRAAPAPPADLAPPPVDLPAPIVSASGTIVPMSAPPPPPVTSSPASSELDADAMSDLASAFQAPPGPADAPTGGAPPVKFHAPLAAESEDGKATVPMYTAYPADPPAGRSVLDDEPARKKGGGAGIGVALLGLLALGAFLLVAAVGLWWTMSSDDDTTAGREPAPVASTKVLPAAAEPAPVVPVVPVEAAPVEDAPVEAAVEPVAVPAATTTTAAAPVSRTTTTTTTTTSRGTSTTTGATAATPRDTPPAAPSGTRGGTTSPVTADAGASSVTSDSVWGTPTAPTSGFLRIVTDPDGATVYVNEAAKGKTPVTIELPYGAHQVRVVRAGYKTEVRDVNIRVRELTVPFNLKPDVVTGQVNVYGPDGFRVVVDGHDMGPMPVTVQVSEGVRQFKLVGTDGSTCNLPKEIKFKAVGRPETITLACP